MTRRLYPLAAVAVAAAIMNGCSGSTPRLPQQAEKRLEQPGPPGSTDLSVTGAFAIEGFAGQSITLPGVVRDVVAPGVFHLAGVIVGLGGVLVVGPPEPGLSPGAGVRVVGEVVPVDQLDGRSGLPRQVDLERVRKDPAKYVVLASEVRALDDVEADARSNGG